MVSISFYGADCLLRAENINNLNVLLAAFIASLRPSIAAIEKRYIVSP